MKSDVHYRFFLPEELELKASILFKKLSIGWTMFGSAVLPGEQVGYLYLHIASHTSIRGPWTVDMRRHPEIEKLQNFNSRYALGNWSRVHALRIVLFSSRPYLFRQSALSILAMV